MFYNLSSGLDILDDPKLQATLHSATTARVACFGLLLRPVRDGYCCQPVDFLSNSTNNKNDKPYVKGTLSVCQCVTLLRVISPPGIPGPREDSDPDTEPLVWSWPNIMRARPGGPRRTVHGATTRPIGLFWGEISDIFNIAIIILNIS